MDEQKIIKLLEENLEYSKKVSEGMQKIMRYIFWRRIASVVKLLIILVPLTLTIIYLPPFFKDMISQYQEILKLFREGI